MADPLTRRRLTQSPSFRWEFRICPFHNRAHNKYIQEYRSHQNERPFANLRQPGGHRYRRPNRIAEQAQIFAHRNAPQQIENMPLTPPAAASARMR
jgi:hypothetical protein